MRRQEKKKGTTQQRDCIVTNISTLVTMSSNKKKPKSVSELRTMLARFGLDTRGTKTVLQDRLYEMIDGMAPQQQTQETREQEPESISDEESFAGFTSQVHAEVHADHYFDANATVVNRAVPEIQSSTPRGNHNLSSIEHTERSATNAGHGNHNLNSIEHHNERSATNTGGLLQEELRRHRAEMEQERRNFRIEMERERTLLTQRQQARVITSRNEPSPQRIPDEVSTFYYRMDRISIQQAADSLPEFDPGDKLYNSSSAFIARIRSLQQYYGWDDRLVLFAAQQKLRGNAKRWNDSGRRLYQSFEEFSQNLRSTFPDLQTDADVHEELVRTNRNKNENLLHFCHRMVAIAQKADLPEQTVVRHILKRINHRDFSVSVINTSISTLTELYAAVARYQHVFPEIERLTVVDTGASSSGGNAKGAPKVGPPTIKTEPVDNNVQIQRTEGRGPSCYNCKQRGHIASSCSQPKIQCGKCNRLGHTEDVCRSSGTAARVMTIQDDANRDQLVKEVLVNNIRMRAFIDGGSKRSLIRRSSAAKVEREEPCVPVQLSGFGGSSVLVQTKISPTVKLDGTIFRAELFVVDDGAIPSDVLLGTELLCRDGNRLVISEGICFVEPVKKTEPVIRPDVAELIAKYPNAFSKSMAELGECVTNKMKIEVMSDKPIQRRPYRIPFSKRTVVDGMVNEMIENKIVRPSESPYASPIVLVKKGNGEDRMCIDYRELNDVTVKQPFPMPIIEELLETLAGNVYFTKLDLMAGYYQVPVVEDSQKYTAFVTHNGHYEFMRMPFGLVNAPSVFQKIMNEVQKLLPEGDVVSYLDDTIIPSITVAEGLQKLERFLAVIVMVGLTLRLDKCEFLATHITFLGHKLSANGIEPGDKKILAIKEFPVPNDVSDVRRFLGLSGFFRKFVDHYAVVAKPLTTLLKTVGNPKFEWTSTQQSAFDELKRLLTSSPVLCLFDPAKRHEVHTDASTIGLAGVLFQEEEEGLKPVFYYSRHCTALERTSPSFELEVLAIVEACERFRAYLIGRHFRIVTDCSAVATTRLTRPLQPKIARWWMKLLEYDFELIHRPGVQLAYVDAMSRAPVEMSREIDCVAECVMRIDIDQCDWLITMQLQDEKLKRIVQVLRGAVMADDEKQIRVDYELEGNRLFRKVGAERKWVVPAGVRWRMLKSAHDDRGHFGLEKTVQNLQQQFWFPRMRNYAKSYIASCIECGYNKRPGGTPEGRLHVSETVPIPFRTVHIDHLGPFPKSGRGNIHVIGIADQFSKYVMVKAVQSTKTQPVLIMLREVSSIFGLPTRIISDRGTAFTSRAFTDYCDANNIQHIQNAVRTPRANGQIERINQSIGMFLRTTTNDARKWDVRLKELQ